MTAACNPEQRRREALTEHGRDDRDVWQVAAARRRVVADEHVTGLQAGAEVLDLEANSLLCVLAGDCM